VTSAESVLISQQSQEELYRVAGENKKLEQEGRGGEGKVIVVSISPQVRASIAAKFNLTVQEAAEKLVTFFKALGANYVLDLTFSRDFALIESAHEFVRRFRNSTAKGSLPMLTSACPGWVCYAEKTHGHYILPYISTTKSPQQIMGSLVKDRLSHSINKTPSDIYHVCVMMCFDKKLEASRSDFYNDLYRTRDVDCVITSVEVEKMFEEREVDFPSLPPLPLDSPFSSSEKGVYYGHGGGGSGGYLEYALKNAAFELYGQDVKEVTYKTLRNRDFREVTLEVGGEPVLRFAAAYGFRNIQNLVQKMKRGKCVYQLVEVMACPSGCLNGGAQIRPGEEETAKDVLTKVDSLYNSVTLRRPEENPDIKKLYSEWLGGKDSAKAHETLHTQYHEVEKFVSALTIKW
jgi:iron only hydrogenase large subunit-like protein